LKQNKTPAWRAMALMGATGTGKSALALEWAQGEGVSIISCDSMQLYKGLDIGTAKATASEQALVVHHLIDCAVLPEVWSAQRWADAALAVIKTENLAGRTPLIVGGTGMYLRALLEGFANIPEEKEGIRAHFEALQSEHGTPYLHDLLSKCDVTLAARLHATDSQRIMRGLCVFETTGIALSAWQAKQQATKSDIDCPVFVLDVERSVLRQRLAERIESMMAVGWLEEVRWLHGLNLQDTHPVMRAVGYRQLLNHLDDSLDDYSLDQALQDAVTATRKYAKRQVTWFRNQTPHAMMGNKEQLKEMMQTRLKQWT